MTHQHAAHARAVALFAGLATAFFVFALQMQQKEQGLAQAAAELTMTAERMEAWRKQNVEPDNAMRRADRGSKGETALKARLRALTRRQDRHAQMQKDAAATDTTETE